MSPPAPFPTAEITLARMRRLLRYTFLAGTAGTAAELGLIGHYEDPWQWIPLVLLGAGFFLGAGFRYEGALRVFQGLMGLFVASGVLGLYLHFRGNMEFELEMTASKRGLALVWDTLTGATPALAPGAMILLGILGGLYTYHHPALAGPSLNQPEILNQPERFYALPDDRSVPSAPPVPPHDQDGGIAGGPQPGGTESQPGHGS